MALYGHCIAVWGHRDSTEVRHLPWPIPVWIPAMHMVSWTQHEWSLSTEPRSKSQELPSETQKTGIAVRSSISPTYYFLLPFTVSFTGEEMRHWEVKCLSQDLTAKLKIRMRSILVSKEEATFKWNFHSASFCVFLATNTGLLLLIWSQKFRKHCHCHHQHHHYHRTMLAVVFIQYFVSATLQLLTEYIWISWYHTFRTYYKCQQYIQTIKKYWISSCCSWPQFTELKVYPDRARAKA